MENTEKSQKSVSSRIFQIVLPVIMFILLAFSFGWKQHSPVIESPLILLISSLYFLILFLYTDYHDYLEKPNIVSIPMSLNIEADKNKDKMSYYFIWMWRLCIYFALIYIVITSITSLF